MKATTTVIIAVAVALIFVGGGLLIFASASHPRGEIYYNYTIDVQDSFVDKYGNVEEADEGKQFAIVTYHIYNKSYVGDISTDPLVWHMDLLLEALQYHYSSWNTISHPKYNLEDIPKGSDAASVQIYEIPAGYTAMDMSIVLYATFTNATVYYDQSFPV